MVSSRTNDLTNGLDREPNMGIFKDAIIDHVFVYGTLKRGFLRNNVLTGGGCTFVREDSLKGYLFHLGAYPCLVPEKKGMLIRGEVWKIPPHQNKSVMNTLDNIEGVPNLYWRYAFRTANGYVCWAYWMSRDRIEDHWQVLTNGKWVGPSLSEYERWGDFMSSNVHFTYPSKIRALYDQTVNAFVCDQFLVTDKPGTKEYEEVSITDTKGVDFVDFQHPKYPYKNSRGVVATLPHYIPKKLEPKPPEPPPLPPLVELVYLDNSEGPPTVCPQTRDDGV